MYENYTGTPTRREPTSDEDTAKDQDVLNEHWEEPGDPDGVIAEDQKRQWQERHPAPEPTPPARRKRKHGFLKFLVIVIIIAAAAVGAFKFGDYKATPATPKTTPKVASTPKTVTPATIPIKHADSTNFLLGFDYPQDWTVVDTAAKLTVTSPSVQLSTVAGAKTSGHVVVTMQNQQTTIAGYPADGAVAVLESAKLTYKQPSAAQRAQTYLSYLSYASATGLNTLYVTGDNGYLAQQYVPLSDVVLGNPLVSVTFQTCATADCATGTPTPVVLLASSWNSASFAKQVLALLESIQLD